MNNEKIANKVARDWRDYGTPNRHQCFKIALEALELKDLELEKNNPK